MKICIDLTSLADNFSGIERFAACISYEMINQNDDNYILIFKDSIHPMFEQMVKRNNVEYIILRRCKKLLFSQIRLPWAIHKIKADFFLFMAFPVPILSSKNNMISTIHDICCWDCPETMNGMSKWYFRLSHKIAIKKCKSIITISEFSKKRIIEKMNYPSEKIWLIYCGIDEKFAPITDASIMDHIRKKYSLPDEYILSLSTLEPRKNIRLLLDGYRDLILTKKCDVPLVFAGRKGWKMKEIMSGIEPEVQSKIIFTGFVDDADLPGVYSGATFFVFPSMYEGFGIPPLEAMACEVPVVSSDAASLPEVLGEAARYFESQNKEDLKKSILYILGLNKKEYDEKIRIGLKQIQKFHWTVEAQKLVYLIKKQDENLK